MRRLCPANGCWTGWEKGTSPVCLQPGTPAPECICSRFCPAIRRHGRQLRFSPAPWITRKMTPAVCRTHSHHLGWPKHRRPHSQGGEWSVSVAHLYCPYHGGASPRSRSRWQLSFAADYSLAASAANLPCPPDGSGTSHAARGRAPVASSGQAGTVAQATWTQAQLTNSGFQNSSTIRALCHPRRHKPGLGESSLAWARSHRLQLHKVRLQR